MRLMRAQGATEYLVLLAIVLIVALVSVALLGFFPGMASDAQVTQSQTYWKSATPIAIVESLARYCPGCATGKTVPYLRIRNVGMYPIQITKLISGSNSATQFYNGSYILFANDPYYRIAPGEEKYVGYMAEFGVNDMERLVYSDTTGSGSITMGGASSLGQNSASAPGMLDYQSFGFEYIEYLDNGQQITKRQIGKDLIIKCLPPY